MIALAVGAAVAARSCAPRQQGGAAQGERLAELEARKEAKYREIRDAELDYRTGKLSQEDHRALDRSLRREAIAILEEIDRATEDDGRNAEQRLAPGPPSGRLQSAGRVLVPVRPAGVHLPWSWSSSCCCIRGRTAGLSGAFGIGGAGAGPFGGGSLVERNLNRWTVGFGVALFVNTIILLKI